MSLAAPETAAEKLYATVHGEGYDAGWRDAREAIQAELEAALTEIAEEMDGAHDGSCIIPVQEIIRRVLRKE